MAGDIGDMESESSFKMFLLTDSTDGFLTALAYGFLPYLPAPLILNWWLYEVMKFLTKYCI
jgi:hypothetical protein